MDSFRTNLPRPHRLRRLALVAGVVLVLAAVAAMAAGCGSAARYDWANLSFQGGRPAYVQDGQAVSAIGIDVSDHQGSIDWQAVADDGVEFAFVRCGRRGYTEGGLFTDENYWTNVQGCMDVGIPYGVYFFSQAISEEEAVEEAEYALSLIEGQDVQLPVVFDHENIEGESARTDGLSSEELTRIADAFCERIQREGYTTLVYGNQHDLSRLDLSALDSDVWFAEYGVEQPTADFDDFALWQYTNEGSVAGISKPVDMNILLDKPAVGL